MEACMDLDLCLAGALVKECVSCGDSVSISACSCAACGHRFDCEPEAVSFDFTASDDSQESDGYVPVHRSPKLLALREAVQEFRAGALDGESYLEVVGDIQASVSPLLRRFEQTARVAAEQMPAEHAWVFTEGLRVYQEYYAAMEEMKARPEGGLRQVEAALKALDEMEKRL